MRKANVNEFNVFSLKLKTTEPGYLMSVYVVYFTGNILSWTIYYV